MYTRRHVLLQEVSDSVLLDMENASRHLDGLPLLGRTTKKPADMAWLDSISQQDRAYLHFGLYHAYNARGQGSRLQSAFIRMFALHTRDRISGKGLHASQA